MKRAATGRFIVRCMSWVFLARLAPGELLNHERALSPESVANLYKRYHLAVWTNFWTAWA
jgi:hypothetical protein